MADILSQDEIDLLLNAVSEDDASAETAEGADEDDLKLITYDFRRPERISKEQMKGLQSLFDAFARELGIVFPPYLRTVMRVELMSIDQLTYDEFILSVARPTALTVVNMSPLEGNAVLEMNPQMIFPIVDRVLGGRGHTLAKTRELTEIEERIVHRIVTMILDTLKRSWEQLIEFDMSIEQQESDPLIVQIVAGSEMVVLVGYEIIIGETTGMMNFCIPLMALNPVLDQISQQAHYARKLTGKQAEVTHDALSVIISRASVPVDVILDRVSLSLQDVVNLQPGDVIPLTTSISDLLAVEVGGIPRFKAKQGCRGEKSAIQIDTLIRE